MKTNSNTNRTRRVCDRLIWRLVLVKDPVMQTCKSQRDKNRMALTTADKLR